jgi:hypothetical protein
LNLSPLTVAARLPFHQIAQQRFDGRVARRDHVEAILPISTFTAID